MVAKRCYLTHVELSEAGSEVFEQEVCFRHGGIALPRVPEVKTESGFWKTLEPFGELAAIPARGLALVHVLDAESLPEDGELDLRGGYLETLPTSRRAPPHEPSHLGRNAWNAQ